MERVVVPIQSTGISALGVSSRNWESITCTNVQTPLSSGVYVLHQVSSPAEVGNSQYSDLLDDQHLHGIILPFCI